MKLKISIISLICLIAVIAGIVAHNARSDALNDEKNAGEQVVSFFRKDYQPLLEEVREEALGSKLILEVKGRKNRKFVHGALVQEVELILMRYEQYYTLEMSGYVRLNLYMHIAFMFERLMIAQDDYEEEQRELSEQEQEFYRISRIVFAEAEKKYRIRLDEYELSMLYELFKSLIK